MSSERYVVQQCESVQSIAAKRGLTWQALWRHPDNADLKRRRDPDVLYPGDTLVIPEKTKKDENGQTEAKHVFQRKGVPSYLRLTFLHEGDPRADERYWLQIDGKTFDGTLDAQGRVDLEIPTLAQRARIKIGDDDETTLLLAGLDPTREVSGYQARLQNLGFYQGAVDGDEGPLTREAIGAFQASRRLPITGKMNDETVAALETAHGDRE